LAIQVCQHLGIDDYLIEQGLKHTKLPARVEVMQRQPLIIIDGAHNHDKVKYLVNKLASTIPNFKNRKLHLICSLADKKKPAQVFGPIKALTDYIYATRFTNSFRKVIPPLELAKAFRNKPTQIFLDPQQALIAAKQKAKPNDIILITGSFYLCSDLRKNWLTEEWQLENRKSFRK
jgi:dihydrofolate synthase/folylpolyglutamate synthase